jgi:hypothetical protein
MPIIRRRRADIDMEKLLTDLAASRVRTEAEIDADAAEDGDAWTEEDLARALLRYPSPTPERGVS